MVGSNIRIEYKRPFSPLRGSELIPAGGPCFGQKQKQTRVCVQAVPASVGDGRRAGAGLADVPDGAGDGGGGVGGRAGGAGRSRGLDDGQQAHGHCRRTHSCRGRGPDAADDELERQAGRVPADHLHDPRDPLHRHRADRGLSDGPQRLRPTTRTRTTPFCKFSSVLWNIYYIPAPKLGPRLADSVSQERYAPLTF